MQYLTFEIRAEVSFKLNKQLFLIPKLKTLLLMLARNYA